MAIHLRVGGTYKNRMGKIVHITKLTPAFYPWIYAEANGVPYTANGRRSNSQVTPGDLIEEVVCDSATNTSASSSVIQVSSLAGLQHAMGLICDDLKCHITDASKIKLSVTNNQQIVCTFENRSVLVHIKSTP